MGCVFLNKLYSNIGLLKLFAYIALINKNQINKEFKYITADTKTKPKLL